MTTDKHQTKIPFTDLFDMCYMLHDCHQNELNEHFHYMKSSLDFNHAANYSFIELVLDVFLAHKC